MVCLSRTYPFKCFKGFLPQNLLSPLLNTLSHILLLGLFYFINENLDTQQTNISVKSITKILDFLADFFRGNNKSIF